MGDPSHVPVGQYAKASLQQQGQWEQWQDRILPTGDAPAAVRLVQLGEADLAIVYATDARASGLMWTPLGENLAVIYECAILRASDSAAARRVYEALASEAAARIYTRHGFVPDAR
jgi:molybdate transport system substrate-binding protein